MGIINDDSMFIKVETYKGAIATIDHIKAKIEDAKKSLNKITELKKEEEVEMELWRRMVNEVESKLGKIDHTLTSAGNK